MSGKTQIEADQIVAGSIADLEISATAAIQISKISINGDVLPDTNNTRALGSAADAFSDLYLKTGLVMMQTGVGTNGITIKSPVSVTSYNLILPATQASGTQVLQNDGSGNLSWAAGGSGADTALDNLSSVAINTALLPGVDNTIALGNSTHNFSSLFLKTSLIMQQTGVGTNAISIQPPSSMVANYSLVLPNAQGAANSVIQNDGSGNLSWSQNLSLSSVYIGTSTINASAILQMDSTTRGFLPPRMTTTQRDAISSPAIGLEIYNTTIGEPEVFIGLAGNVLLNGGFETWTHGTTWPYPASGTQLADNWYTSGSTGCVIMRSNTSHSGIYSIAVYNGSTPHTFAMLQDVAGYATYEGKTVQATVYIRSQGASNSWTLTLTDGVSSPTYSAVPANGSWTQFQVSLAVSLSATKLEIRISCANTAGGGTGVFIDDASIAVPSWNSMTPATVPAAGTNGELLYNSSGSVAGTANITTNGINLTLATGSLTSQSVTVGTGNNYAQINITSIGITVDTSGTYDPFISFNDTFNSLFCEFGINHANADAWEFHGASYGGATLAGTLLASITQTGNFTPIGNITLLNQKSVIFNDTEGTPKSVTINAPTTVTTSYSLVLPNAQGASNTVLQNDGSGNLNWAIGAIGANVALSNLSSVAINTSLLPASNASIDLGTNYKDWRSVYVELCQVSQQQMVTQTIALGFNASVPIFHAIAVGQTLYISLGSFFQIT
jgi:hypothetical protein